MARTDAEIIADVVPYAKSSPERFAAMVDAVKRIDRDRISGDIVECGVWRGGNIILARKLSPDRVCWLFDTFTGMTAPQAVDVTRSGKKAIDSYNKKMEIGAKWSGVSVEDVRSNLDATGTLDERLLRFVVGDVSETLLEPANVPECIALLRLDTDWHASTKIELETLYPRLAVGGVLIVDDYGHWMGARKAVDDYFSGRGFEFTVIDYTAISMVKTC